MKKQILFIHSAGAQGRHQRSGDVAAYLQDALGAEYEVLYPKMPDPESPQIDDFVLREDKTMKHLYLAYEEENKLNAMSKNKWDALRGKALSYLEELRKNGHIITAETLQSARTATTLRVRHGKGSITDGPFAETKETLG